MEAPVAYEVAHSLVFIRKAPDRSAAEMEQVLRLFRDVAHGALREVDHLAFIIADPRALRTVLGGERAQPFAAAVLHSHA